MTNTPVATMPLGSSQSDQIWNHLITRWIAVIPGSIVAVVLTSVATNIIAAIWGSGQGTWLGMEVTSDDPRTQQRLEIVLNAFKRNLPRYLSDLANSAVDQVDFLPHGRTDGPRPSYRKPRRG